MDYRALTSSLFYTFEKSQIMKINEDKFEVYKGVLYDLKTKH